MLNNYSTRSITWIRTLVLTLFLAAGMNATRASHIAGSDLTYQSLGNGTYLVTYTMYRDCFGITAPSSAYLSVASNSCGQAVQSIQMTQVPGTGQEITPTCSTSASTCNGGTEPGIEEYEYTALVQLPLGCPDWHLWVDDCCRNQAITTVQNPDAEGLYIEAYLNNTVVESSSPTFNNVPIVFFCIGQTNYFNLGAVDADGDSMVYYFITPRNSENDPLVYNTGFSVANPLSSSPAVSIDALTGDIAVNPTQQEIGIISVMVEEYRNGVLLGRVMRDIQVYTVACSNTLPSLSGVNGSTTFTTSACVGGSPLCFNINSSDNNNGDSLWLSWNNGIPGATFNPGTGARPIGQFCWTPTPADARPNPYTFTVTVHDNACPSPGVQTYSFSIIVGALNTTITSSPSVSCNGDADGTATAGATGVGPFTYLWSPGGQTTASVSGLAAGTYNVTITDATGCQGAESFTITQPSPIALNVSGSAALCSNGPGSATVVATGGTPGYTYTWNTTPAQTGATASNLSPGVYTVTVVDDNQCSAIDSVELVGSAPVDLTLNVNTASCATNDGGIDALVNGGTGPFTYTWTPNVSSSNSAINLAAGNYEVIVVDQNGCSDTASATINQGTLPAVTISQSPGIGCTSGTIFIGYPQSYITLTANSSTTGLSYQWYRDSIAIAGATANIYVASEGGNYSVVATDANGCSSDPTAFALSVNEVDVRCGKDGRKVVLCHVPPGNPGNPQTICIAPSAVPAHLTLHPGDCLGPCTVNRIDGSYIEESESMSVSPNPFSSSITISFEVFSDQTIELAIYDLEGRMVQQLTKQDFDTDSHVHEEFNVSTLTNGVYFVKYTSGDVSVFRKITKVN